VEEFIAARTRGRIASAAAPAPDPAADLAAERAHAAFCSALPAEYRRGNSPDWQTVPEILRRAWRAAAAAAREE